MRLRSLKSLPQERSGLVIHRINDLLRSGRRLLDDELFRKYARHYPQGARDKLQNCIPERMLQIMDKEINTVGLYRERINEVSISYL